VITSPVKKRGKKSPEKKGEFLAQKRETTRPSDDRERRLKTSSSLRTRRRKKREFLSGKEGKSPRRHSKQEGKEKGGTGGPCTLSVSKSRQRGGLGPGRWSAKTKKTRSSRKKC